MSNLYDIMDFMTRYKAKIAYDGTDFCGFQTQENGRTVQEELEKVLTRLNSHEKVILQGSGRTDSGVHALGQIVHFDLTGNPRDAEKLRFALDTQTSSDLAVLEVSVVSDDFHARFTKHEKTYEYLLDNSSIRSPFKRRNQAWFRYPLDFDLMEKALSNLTGTHDFTGFTASGSSVDDKVRTIYEASLVKIDETTFKFTFRGNGFLYKQIRNMVGTVIKIGNGKFPLSRIDEILQSKNRDLAGPTAHPEGLYLKEVNYLEENDDKN